VRGGPPPAYFFTWSHMYKYNVMIRRINGDDYALDDEILDIDVGPPTMRRLLKVVQEMDTTRAKGKQLPPVNVGLELDDE
jgi:hypothetical protein